MVFVGTVLWDKNVWKLLQCKQDALLGYSGISFIRNAKRLVLTEDLQHTFTKTIPCYNILLKYIRNILNKFSPLCVAWLCILQHSVALLFVEKFVPAKNI